MPQKNLPGFGYWSNELNGVGLKNWNFAEVRRALPIARQQAAALRDFSPLYVC